VCSSGCCQSQRASVVDVARSGNGSVGTGNARPQANAASEPRDKALATIVLGYLDGMLLQASSLRVTKKEKSEGKNVTAAIRPR
jgi:hypothetical protein